MHNISPAFSHKVLMSLVGALTYPPPFNLYPSFQQYQEMHKCRYVKILIITYKTLHGLAPAYIEDLLVSYIPGRYLRSAKNNLLAVPGFKLNSYGRRAFSVAAPLLWNSLPQHVRDAESLDIFKRQLKTVLFKRAFLS